MSGCGKDSSTNTLLPCLLSVQHLEDNRQKGGYLLVAEDQHV